MKKKTESYYLDKMIAIVKCFSNQRNIEIIKLLQQKEILNRLEIALFLKLPRHMIARNLFDMTQLGLLKIELNKSKWYYRLNNDLVEKVLDFAKSLG